ncbi:MAG: type I-C CRISPR-associated protein Cas7/Csd2 [Sterolibacteriaceae bacterium]|uniref:Type I-C CRISPR-associated protein Cas7/Csd2 n=1 Tax=Candidatus Methylophosphatis roskildensis TaxID=2899263 RepID=A0A9D7HME6_9PROT|nr:type I-C CRISPR-associated protein Cas7/Csd2 [Candidatus Methylophosphatis roskildensis]MBK7234633.1 type I-C CRISPR-associated protein Cas7/Csd2 [Sterolibacteriaceae bacterium]
MSLTNRYDFVLVFDVRDGNPNGDPDAGNLPRLDAESGHGLVTDVSLKRKVRNFVGMVKGETPPFDIYVKEKAILNQAHEKAYVAIGAKDALKGEDKKRKGSGDIVDQARRWMCANFYDVRTFGAVMSLGVNCGQVRGPVQLTFARSVEPIVALEHSITRMAVATEAEAEKQQGDNRTMGRKHTVPYGLYVAHGFISAFLAKQTGFGDDDLELLWQALEQMFEHDRSAARGEMATRGLYVFKHDSELGNAHAHALFDRVQIKRNEGVEVPRNFVDYRVSVDAENLPAGVTLIPRVG